MPISARRFKGELKRDIATKAFQEIGVEATIQQVDAYFKKYGLPNCERSMYAAARRKAKGRPSAIPRRYRRNNEDKKDVIGIVVRTQQLAADVGSYDNLEELIRLLRTF